MRLAGVETLERYAVSLSMQLMGVSQKNPLVAH